MREQALHEVEVLRGFLTASRLEIDPASVASVTPPRPDIRCTKYHDGVCHFELAEILWEDPNPPVRVTTLAHGLAISQREGERKDALLAAGRVAEAAHVQTCGAFSAPPLAALLQALEKKCGKRYETDGTPLHLLLYYERESPVEPFELLADDPCRAAVQYLLAGSHFRDVWVYHHATGYHLNLAGMGNSDGKIIVPLREFQTPESQRRVIAHLAITNDELRVAFDASYSQEYQAAADVLTEVRKRYDNQRDTPTP
jgi:hypothetical protein